MTTPEPKAPASLTLSWRVVAITTSCMALGFAATLGVIVARGDADYLSTLALTLAVVAFAVQLIIFIAQTFAASMQLSRAEELHGLTARALAAIEEKAEGTRQTVNSISDRMLQAVLGQAVPEAAEKGVRVDSPEFARRLNELIDAAATRGAVAPPTSSVEPAARATGVDDIPLAAVLPFPAPTEAGEYMVVLRELPEEALLALHRLGQDFRRYGSANTALEPGLSVELGGDELDAVGLATVQEKGWEGTPVRVLTEKGKKAAALLCADWIPNDYPLRHELRAIRAKMFTALGKWEAIGSRAPAEPPNEG